MSVLPVRADHDRLDLDRRRLFEKGWQGPVCAVFVPGSKCTSVLSDRDGYSERERDDRIDVALGRQRQHAQRTRAAPRAMHEQSRAVDRRQRTFDALAAREEQVTRASSRPGADDEEGSRPGGGERSWSAALPRACA